MQTTATQIIKAAAAMITMTTNTAKTLTLIIINIIIQTNNTNK